MAEYIVDFDFVSCCDICGDIISIKFLCPVCNKLAYINNELENIEEKFFDNSIKDFFCTVCYAEFEFIKKDCYDAVIKQIDSKNKKESSNIEKVPSLGGVKTPIF